MSRFFKGIISTIGFFFMILLAGIVLPFSIAYQVYSYFVAQLIRYKEGLDSSPVVSPNDSIWLQDNERNNTIIETVFLLRGEPYIDKIRKDINSRIMEMLSDGIENHRRFAQFIAFRHGQWLWVDEKDFSIRDHIIPFRGRKVPKNEIELQREIGALMSDPLPSRLAPWQLIVIPTQIKTQNDQPTFALLLRIHHCMADGISLINMLLEKLSTSDPRAKTMKKPRTLNLGVWWFLKTFLRFEHILKLVMPAQKNILNGRARELSGEKVVAWSRPIPLAEIKAVKTTIGPTALNGVTLNDLTMSMISGAFSDYLRDEQKVDLPNRLSITVPIAIRQRTLDPPLFENRLGMARVELPVGAKTPLARLEEMKAIIDELKDSAISLVFEKLSVAIMSSFPNFFSREVFNFFGSKLAMIVSNLPGPADTIFISGYPVERFLFWPPGRGTVATSVSIFTYCDNLYVGVMADRAVLPTPEVIVENFYNQLKELKSQIEN